MKVHIGYRKKGNKLEYGVTVYSENSKVLFSNTKLVDDLKSDGKFLNALNNLIWGIKQINIQTERGELPTDELLVVILGNKTIYKWFENKSTIKAYAVKFADLMFEINLLMNDVEVIYSDNSSKKVLYKKSGTKDDSTLIKLTDMFEGVDE